MGKEICLTWDKWGQDKAFDVDGLQQGSSSASSGEKRFRLVKFNQLSPRNVIPQKLNIYINFKNIHQQSGASSHNYI